MIKHLSLSKKVYLHWEHNPACTNIVDSGSMHDITGHLMPAAAVACTQHTRRGEPDIIPVVQ